MQRTQWVRRYNVVLIYAVVLVGLVLLNGCSLNPNADVSEQLTQAGTEIQTWVPLLRVVSYGILALGWTWYLGMYGLSLFGMDQYWNKHRDWWKMGAAITVFGGAIIEAVIAAGSAPAGGS